MRKSGCRGGGRRATWDAERAIVNRHIASEALAGPSSSRRDAEALSTTSPQGVAGGSTEGTALGGRLLALGTTGGACQTVGSCWESLGWGRRCQWKFNSIAGHREWTFKVVAWKVSISQSRGGKFNWKCSSQKVWSHCTAHTGREISNLIVEESAGRKETCNFWIEGKVEKLEGRGPFKELADKSLRRKKFPLEVLNKKEEEKEPHKTRRDVRRPISLGIMPLSWFPFNMLSEKRVLEHEWGGEDREMLVVLTESEGRSVR